MKAFALLLIGLVGLILSTAVLIHPKSVDVQDAGRIMFVTALFAWLWGFAESER